MDILSLNTKLEFCFQLQMMLSGINSFESLCTMDLDSGLNKPINSTWDANAWLGGLCQLTSNDSQILAEMMSLPGAYRIAMIVRIVIIFLLNH